MNELQRLENEKHELEMTPMIDVTFLLLIFFLCTLQFKTLEGKLAAYLPKDVGPGPSTSEPAEEVRIQVQVREEGTRFSAATGEPWPGYGRYLFGSDRVLEYRVNSSTYLDLDSLGARIEELGALDPERRVVVDARSAVQYGEVVEVLDRLLGAGFGEVTFAAAR